MSAPDRIWCARPGEFIGGAECGHWFAAERLLPGAQSYLRADGPTITAYREALRLLGADPDIIAREAEKEAQNG